MKPAEQESVGYIAWPTFAPRDDVVRVSESRGQAASREPAAAITDCHRVPLR
jgi:hypothetical protein